MNTFQKTLLNDIRNMSDSHVYVKGDKSSNYYKLSPDKSEQLRIRDIQAEYKRSSDIT